MNVLLKDKHFLFETVFNLKLRYHLSGITYVFAENEKSVQENVKCKLFYGNEHNSSLLDNFMNG